RPAFRIAAGSRACRETRWAPGAAPPARVDRVLTGAIATRVHRSQAHEMENSEIADKDSRLRQRRSGPAQDVGRQRLSPTRIDHVYLARIVDDALELDRDAD